MRRTLAILCTAAPFVAAAIAALGARHDFRILWIAIVATIVAQGASMVATNRRAAAIAAFVVAGILGCVVSIVAGARAPFGVIAVAVVVAAFATAGAFLQTPSVIPATQSAVE